MNCPSSVAPIPSRRANSLETLRLIANLRYPDERSQFSFSTSGTERREKTTLIMQNEFTLTTKKATEKIWPELWEDPSRALAVLREIRDLLQRFWAAEGEHARGWHIYRAREYYQRFMIQREFRQKLHNATTGSAFSTLNREMDKKLNEPPARSAFENALFKLQERARTPSLAPCICANKARPLPPGIRISDREWQQIQLGMLCPIDQRLFELVNESDEACSHPYFLRSKKRRKFCSRACARKMKQKSDLKSWHEHKHEWRPHKEKQ
jgi:hypothetical protein